MRWKVLGLIVFAIVIAAFTLANTTEVSVSFVFATAKTNLVLVILLSVFLGMILMAILWSLRAWKLRGQLGTLKKKLAQVESELEAIRKREEERIHDEQTKQDSQELHQAHTGVEANPSEAEEHQRNELETEQTEDEPTEEDQQQHP